MHPQGGAFGCRIGPVRQCHWKVRECGCSISGQSVDKMVCEGVLFESWALPLVHNGIYLFMCVCAGGGYIHMLTHVVVTSGHGTSPTSVGEILQYGHYFWKYPRARVFAGKLKLNLRLSLHICGLTKCVVGYCRMCREWWSWFVHSKSVRLRWKD